MRTLNCKVIFRTSEKSVTTVINPEIFRDQLAWGTLCLEPRFRRLVFLSRLLNWFDLLKCSELFKNLSFHIFILDVNIFHRQIRRCKTFHRREILINSKSQRQDTSEENQSLSIFPSYFLHKSRCACFFEAQRGQDKCFKKA